MFEELKNANQRNKKNFSAAPGLRLCSDIILVSAGVLLVLSVIAAFVLFCLKDLWWIGLVVIAGALVLFFIQWLVSLLIHGFAEIIDNTKDESKGLKVLVDRNKEELEHKSMQNLSSAIKKISDNKY